MLGIWRKILDMFLKKSVGEEGEQNNTNQFFIEYI